MYREYEVLAVTIKVHATLALENSKVYLPIAITIALNNTAVPSNYLLSKHFASLSYNKILTLSDLDYKF